MCADAADAGAAIGRDALQQGCELVFFTAKTDEQDAAGIGIASERCKQARGGVQIIAQLRTAERMGEGKDGIDAASVTEGGLLRDTIGGAGNAANGRDDPYFIAGADRSVGAAIAPEGPVGGWSSDGR